MELLSVQRHRVVHGAEMHGAHVPNALQCGLERYFTPEQSAKMAAVCIGFAGAGGLGSNAAMLLARSGMQSCVLVDYDRVECSNLNRQHFFPEHLGMFKVKALEQQLLLLNNTISCITMNCLLDADTVQEVMPLADIWVEALDDAATKRFFVEQCLIARKFVVTASGIAGWGADMQRRELDMLVQVGDGASDVATLPPCAPRVVMAAAMQADAVLKHVLGACFHS